MGGIKFFLGWIFLSGAAFAANQPQLFFTREVGPVPPDVIFQTKISRLPTTVLAPRIAVMLTGPQCNATVVDALMTASDVTGAPVRARPLGNGWFQPVSPTVAALQFRLFQPQFQAAHCRLSVYRSAPGDTPPPAGDTGLVGVIAYTGGFHQGLQVSVNDQRVAKSFRIAIPGFCAGVEILDAGTFTDGVWNPAQPTTENNFSINEDQGNRISAVRFSLNGPHDVKCDIPVYVFF